MNNEKAIDMKQEDQDMTEEEATITTMLTKTQVQSEEEEEVDPMLYDSTAAVATGGGHWSSDEWDKGRYKTLFHGFFYLSLMLNSLFHVIRFG